MNNLKKAKRAINPPKDPICPGCKKIITTLINIKTGTKTWKMDKKGDYEELDFESDNNINDWNCPICDHTITQDEENAINFLNNEPYEN